jgi:hypothetical protein
MRAPESVTLRFAFPDDERALVRLAALDSAAVPDGPLLLAEVGGELRAAMSLSDGGVIADPFHFTEELIALLQARGAQLARAPSRPRLRSAVARLRSGMAARAATLR